MDRDVYPNELADWLGQPPVDLNNPPKFMIIRDEQLAQIATIEFDDGYHPTNVYPGSLSNQIISLENTAVAMGGDDPQRVLFVSQPSAHDDYEGGLIVRIWKLSSKEITWSIENLSLAPEHIRKAADLIQAHIKKAAELTANAVQTKPATARCSDW